MTNGAKSLAQLIQEEEATARLNTEAAPPQKESGSTAPEHTKKAQGETGSRVRQSTPEGHPDEKTSRIEEFTSHYLQTFNATEAYLKISPKVKRTTAARSATRMLRRDEVRAVLALKAQEIGRRNEVSEDMVVKHWLDMIQREGDWPELSDDLRVRAVENIAKMLGMFRHTDEEVENIAQLIRDAEARAHYRSPVVLDAETGKVIDG